MNAQEIMTLVAHHSLADGMAIDSEADVELTMIQKGRRRHLIITSEMEMYLDGWIVTALQPPEQILSITQHAYLTYGAILDLHRRFVKKH